MALTYASARRTQEATAEKKSGADAAGPSLVALAAGAAPTAPQMGHQVDLPGGIREKMESSFGADFSRVRLFESQTVADAGAEAMTQGSNIAFAPGKLDLASTAGQALLGHELSHVVSQARGESAGRGFLDDAHLEAQADRQGMMAARGESVYSGPVSPVGMSSTMSAAGPMQAKKKKDVISAPQYDEEASRKENDSFAKTILENMGDISDKALFNEDLMQFVSAQAGENARDDMAYTGTDYSWNALSMRGFRGGSNRNSDAGRAFQNLTTAIAFRKLEGGKGEDGKLRTNLTSQFSAEDGQGNLAKTMAALQAPENESVVRMLENYQDHAFHIGDERSNALSDEQKSAMIMNNTLNSFGAAAGNAGSYNAGENEGRRMYRLMAGTMGALKGASAQKDKNAAQATAQAPAQGGTPAQGQEAQPKSVADQFLEMLVPEYIDLGGEEEIPDIDELEKYLELAD